MQPIIEVKNLKKRYKIGVINRRTLTAELQTWWANVRGKEDPNLCIGEKVRLQHDIFMALNGVDLTVERGEALGIIGINGAGKSTLLKHLCHITAPTEGEIILRGKITSMLEVGTGFNEEMTGLENIYLNGSILGMTRQEINEKLDEIIEFSECGDFINTPAKRYSSGMRVKLAFAVASHLESDIIIMDEVLTVGDVQFQKKCLDKMNSLARTAGKTILYVSHNMDTIRRLCTRCIVMKEGQIIYNGDVEEAIQVYAQESFAFNLKTEFPITNTHRIHLKTIEILEKDDLFFKNTDKMKLKLSWKSELDEPITMLRMTVKYMGATAIGSYTKNDFEIKQSDDSSAEIELNLEPLLKGKYSCDIQFARIQNGTTYQFSFYQNAFGFDIIESTGLDNFHWPMGTWGWSKLPDIEICEKKL